MEFASYQQAKIAINKFDGAMTKGECASFFVVAFVLSFPTLRVLLLDHPQRSSTRHLTLLRVLCAAPVSVSVLTSSQARQSRSACFLLTNPERPRAPAPVPAHPERSRAVPSYPESPAAGPHRNRHPPLPEAAAVQAVLVVADRESSFSATPRIVFLDAGSSGCRLIM
jgi:hypothetical protein